MLRRLVRGGKGFRFNLADQVLSAASNLALVFLATSMLADKNDAGAMLLAVTVAMFVVNVNRAFVGDTLLSLLPRASHEARKSIVTDAVAASLVWSSAAAMGIIVICILSNGKWGLGGLCWVAPALPLIVLQDTGRYAAFAAGLPQRALAIDLIWVIGQGTFVAIAALLNAIGSATLLTTWGAGALLGALLWLFKERVNPVRGNPAHWIRAGGRISGWLTGMSLIGQVQVQILAFSISGLFGSGHFADYRLMQTILLSPAQNLMMAAVGVRSSSVERSSRG